MQWIRTTFHKFLDQRQTPGFAAGTGITILGAVVIGLVGQAIQSSLDLPIVAIYLMTGIVLICLIFVARFLDRVVTLVENSEKRIEGLVENSEKRIEKLVENPLMNIEKLVENSEKRIEKLVEKHNDTRFITSKVERLDLMTYHISNATKSIYIISDLSGTEETQTDEHKKYLKALDQVLSKQVEVKRIVMPPYAKGKNTEVDPDWIYTASTTEAYREHFKLLQGHDNYAMSHTNVPLNVSMILIDNKYLFWKPELTYGDKELEKLFDGGLYWEDFTQEGLAHFIKTFEKLEKKARWTDPAKAPWTNLDKVESRKP